MPKFIVHATVEGNFSLKIEADTQEEAYHRAKEIADTLFDGDDTTPLGCTIHHATYAITVDTAIEEAPSE